VISIFDDLLSISCQLEDVGPGPGAIHDVDIAPIICVGVVGLNGARIALPSLANVGVLIRLGDKMRDLHGLERIADID